MRSVVRLLPPISKRLAIFALAAFPTFAPGSAPSEGESAWSHYRPAFDRLKPRPGWEVDVTESLRGRVAPDGKWEPFSVLNSREARVGRVKGGTVEWQGSVAIPAAAERGWPLALEADEARVILEATWKGAALGAFSRAGKGDLWGSGEGAVLVPAAAGESAALTLVTRDLPQIYPGGFGRLRIRPATLDEVLTLDSPGSSGAAMTVRNRSDAPLAGTVRWVQEDYFGVPLAEGEAAFETAAAGRATIGAPPAKPGVYKTRYRIEAAGRRSLEYWDVPDLARTLWGRAPVLRLDAGWEYVFSPSDLAKSPPPSSGWKAVPELPFEPSAEEYTSHWMWARTTFTIPEDWPAGRQIEILLPSAIRSHARVLLDGQEIARLGSWDLPARIVPPIEAKPGSTHTLELGITDYVAGLAPGVKAPERGPMQPVGRGLDAPISSTYAMGIALDAVPEISAVPTRRVDAVRVKTAGDRVEAAVTIVGAPREQLRLAGTVRLRGDVLAPVEPREVTLDASGRAEVTLTASVPSAARWSPESPVLHELRAELTDAAGRPLDEFRTRFGFREIGVKDGHYTLNGDRINLLGGSHVYSTGFRWPVYAHPYRIMRHGYNGARTIGGGTASGMAAINAADEMGYLLKTADWSVNAHCADNYAWHRPLIWERLRATWKAATDLYGNHPSIVMWDVANEVSFRGDGEDRKMGELFADIRRMDPTRLVTIGGSFPHPANVDVLNFHGWGEWNNRADYFFMHPEERPGYLRDAGFFARRPESDPSDAWKVDLSEPGTSKQLTPGVTRDLRHIDGVAPFFAEGHYYESSLPVSLLGHDAYLRQLDANDWYGYHGLNILGTRSRSIVNVRQAGIPASMIHVDRGIGRAAFPLAAFPWERRVRFRAGEPIAMRYGVHYDLSTPSEVDGRFRLFDESRLIGEQTFQRVMKPGEVALVDLSFPAVATRTDRTLRLEVRVGTPSGEGWFSDDVDLTVMAATPFAMPAGQTLAVFDPAGETAAFLRRQGISFEEVGDPAAWKPSPTETLLIGPDALGKVPPAALAQLGRKVAEGGRLIVLDHGTLPRFLRTKLVQNPDFGSHAARMDFDSPILRGVTTEDLRAWQTRDNDQIVVRGPLDVPSYGNFRVHATTVKSAPVLEVAEGKGRVVFAQLNLGAALGRDPAADRVLANLLAWTGAPSPFGNATTLLVTSDPVTESTLVGRFGLQAQVAARPTAADIDKAQLIVAPGDEPAALEALTPLRDRLRQRIQAGANLVVTNLDPAGATWLTALVGKPVEVSEFPRRHAYLLASRSPVTAGLGHGDFFTSRLGNGINPDVPASGSEPLTARMELGGAAVSPLTRPACLAEIPVGRGRVVITTTESLKSPLPGLARILSTVLGNAGARLDPEGTETADKTAWTFRPVDLSRFVNRPLVDSNRPGAPRGWNASGEQNDLRSFPTGARQFEGVDYVVATPARPNGNAIIALSGAKANLPNLPAEVNGIPVNARADRLYFLHTSVWGEPEFIYRVYYKEDRAAWIPGKPDPFVDVVVKPGENIADWVYAGSVARGDRFLPGATVGWLGGTDTTRRSSATGAADVGVYQMTWDNPHPEKTIESIDILSPGQRGSGHPFVFGITAATRRDDKPTPAPLSDVLPAGVRPERVAYQGRFSRYGYVLLTDGTLGAVYDRGGRRFASSKGWVMEAITGGSGQPQQTQKLAGQSRQRPTIETREEPGRVVHEIRGDLPEITYEATITATSGGLRYELRYTPKASIPADGKIQIISALDLENATTEGYAVNEIPVPIKTAQGLGSFTFERRYVTWVFSYFVSADRIFLVSPPKSGAPYEPGRADSLWWELTPP